MGRFRVKSVGTDVLVCREWNGTTEGATDINVALPYLLQRTPFDASTRDGVNYTYTSNIERSASDGTNIETQYITPGYVVNDEIFAVKAGFVSGGIGEDSGGVSLGDWLDLNVDGRAWAAV